MLARGTTKLTITRTYQLPAFLPLLGLLFVFLLFANHRRLLTESLARLFSCLFISHIVPPFCFFIHPEKATGWQLTPPFANDIKRDEGLVQAFAIDVIKLAVFYNFAVPLVSQMVICSSCG
jgi:hypothetical protein